MADMHADLILFTSVRCHGCEPSHFRGEAKENRPREDPRLQLLELRRRRRGGRQTIILFLLLVALHGMHGWRRIQPSGRVGEKGSNLSGAETNSQDFNSSVPLRARTGLPASVSAVRDSFH